MIKVYYYNYMDACETSAIYTYDVLPLWRDDPCCIYIIDYTTGEVLYINKRD